MKNIFVLPNASQVYKEFEKARKDGKLDLKEFEWILFKALYLLEDMEGEKNKLESELKWGKEKPFW